MDLLSNLWKLPSGMEREDGVNGNLKWTSKYGSVVATAFDLIAVDGMNEEGFAGHILWLAESDYGDPAPADTQLSQAVWLQYYLDNFKTVKEAVAWTKKSKVQIKQLFDPTGHLVPTLHLALNDATGHLARMRAMADRFSRAVSSFDPAGASCDIVRLDQALRRQLS